MLELLYFLYRKLFTRKAFYNFNKLLYGLSLRGIGVMNFESDKQSGEKHFIQSQLPKIKNGVVFDVGANEGSFSRQVRAANPNIPIYAFEPHPKTFQRLSKNVEQLDIKTYNVGVGSAEGMLTLYDYVNEDGSCHASLYKDVIEEIYKGQTTAYNIKIISLDAFVSEHNIERICLLKIDTEGHEMEVLKGFVNFIEQNKVDYIHFEFNEMNVVSRVFFKDFWQILPNYDFYRMLPDGLVPISDYRPVYNEIFAYQNIVAKLK